MFIGNFIFNNIQNNKGYFIQKIMSIQFSLLKKPTPVKEQAIICLLFIF